MYNKLKKFIIVPILILLTNCEPEEHVRTPEEINVGTISGTIKSIRKINILEANINLVSYNSTNSVGKTVRTIKSGTDGAFTFSLVDTGKMYKIIIEKAGFKKYASSFISLLTIKEKQLDVVMNDSLNMIDNNTFVTLPVIFHIIFNNTNYGVGNNISADVVNAQLNQLNAYFRNQIAPYKSVDTNMEFYLAETKPDGTPLTEPGINRVYNSTAVFIMDSLMDSSLARQLMWNPNYYINIIVATTDISKENSAVGMAHLPFVTSSNPLFGLPKIPDNYNVLPTYFHGITLNVEYFKKDVTTFVHEMGHYWGLKHLFSEKDCKATNDDGCADTYFYNRELYNYKTDGYVRNLCNGSNYIADNYMDYYYHYDHKFTPDQLTRMRSVLSYSPYRANLMYVKKPRETSTNKSGFIEIKPTVVE